ncbi:hypothetical protein PZN02_004760 [Sinorhizobium garamanticum]|uniref:Uncharacterized protein n=1 Tax=Sinorhizobium garamanticum TaxID=680247 RepID=A0ABY8DLI7_9HYPH|nr:hypothetical protein [Sinorhizobium garamanticum]WEX91132.1 hypothetical protein PZN02_004760 [Sinorhizobium garamanticum]
MPCAALGFRVHSGWAALVAVAGSPDTPVIADRRRIEIADPAVPGSRQPYHAAEGLPLEKARSIIQHCEHSSERFAQRALRTAIDRLRQSGYVVVGCGVLVGSGRPLPGLEATLASHTLIHAAEGEFFRNAVRAAATACGLTVTGIRESELVARAAIDLGSSEADLLRRLADLGRSVGPPWQQDQKYAALVAWLALVSGLPRPAART